jgi:hypothetical protein
MYIFCLYFLVKDVFLPPQTPDLNAKVLLPSFGQIAQMVLGIIIFFTAKNILFDCDIDREQTT